MSTNGSFSQQDQYKNTTEQYPATSGPAETNTNASGNGDLSKDEVGWYFVEQYYTTLSKSPEKLHLFYGKRSQFVSGAEAEVVPVSVGRSAIQERIRELDFQDCKVRVSNVDSQASFDNIVIQVIGETSNKSAELKKFVQTFVLAQQPTGYFVLNDIFRYINEEGEEEAVEGEAAEETAAPAATSEVQTEEVEAPKPETEAEESATADKVEKSEPVADEEPAAVEAPTTNGAGEAAPAPAVEEPATPTEAPAPEVVEQEVEQEAIREVETPKEPTSTPQVTDAQPAAEKPAAPTKPMSWASRAAAAVVSAPKPAVPATIPVPKSSTPPAQSRPAPAAQAPKAAQPVTTTPPVEKEKEKKDDGAQGAGWQTAGGDHSKRQNRPQSISQPPEKEGTMGYVKYVTEKVVAEELRSALASFGELVYFDINRSKNCAFVEYATPAGYQAAAAANPHQVSGESIYVEPRRPKASGYGGNFNPTRGGMNQRGRGGFEQGRGGGQGGRGNFQQNRGRGGSAARGGRTASQPANA
ncbi:hypothetical protein F5884DRAFT_204379 [Xylogone sp. PMI_703]|nr:hypothetical protein F5884DRAFT_204379 [Xylogone sp. PMI_703]